MVDTDRNDTAPLISQLEETARRHGDRLALVHGDVRLTWGNVETRTAELARGLIALGIERGDNIALWLPNRPDWLLLWLAAMRIGAAAVPINTRYRPGEAAYILEKSEAVALFVEPVFMETDYVAALREICPDWPEACARLPKLRHVVSVAPGEAQEGVCALDAVTEAGGDVAPDRLEARRQDAAPDDRVIIVFTSGTTGNPKGVVHTHAALRMMRSVVDWMGVGPEDRILGHLPLFHVAGVFSSFLPAMITGGALVQMDAWDLDRALELIAAEKVSVLSGIPTHFIDLIRHNELARFDLASLRTGWIGGATVPVEVVAGAEEKLGMTALLPVYGMTETTSTTTLARPGDPRERIVAGQGVPLGGYEVETVDPETRRPVPAGTEGEIRVRGYTVMKEYYRDPEATAEVLDAAGWFHTGDLGVFDEAGYLTITGRLTDKFIVGGNNVHPADIEHVLQSHPGVKQAHVVGGPDDRLGEVAVAFVERMPGAQPAAEELSEFCRTRLASFKVPRRIVFMDAWPMTPTGKVQRFRLREMAAGG